MTAFTSRAIASAGSRRAYGPRHDERGGVHGAARLTIPRGRSRLVTPERRIEALRSAVATGLPQNAALACQKDMEHDRTGVVSAVDRAAGLRSRLADAYVRSAPGGIRLAYLLTGDRTVAEDLVQEAFVRFVGRLRFPSTRMSSSRTCDARS